MHPTADADPDPWNDEPRNKIAPNKNAPNMDPRQDGIRDDDMAIVEWEYVRARRRRGRAEATLPVRPLLVDAGVAMAYESGIDRVSLAECARRAGVSAGAPYSWFTGSAEFRSTVVAGVVQGLLTEIPHDGGRDAIDLLAATCRATVLHLASARVGLDNIFGPDDGAAGRDLAYAREQLHAVMSERIHRASGCRCDRSTRACPVTVPAWDDVFAVCHGAIALAVLAPDDAGRAAAADAGARAVVVLLRERFDRG